MSDQTQESRIKKALREDVKRAQEQKNQNRQTGKQLGLGVPNEEDTSFEDLFSGEEIDSTQNPPESHSLYYSIQEVMKSNLPTGGAAKSLRDFVYNEKNVFLTRGHDLDEQGIRGADSRQAYIPDLRVALKEVNQWARIGGSGMDLWERFRELNEKAGYYEEDSHRASPVGEDPSA